MNEAEVYFKLYGELYYTVPFYQKNFVENEKGELVCLE